jgi:hypothetical protein
MNVAGIPLESSHVGHGKAASVDSMPGAAIGYKVAPECSMRRNARAGGRAAANGDGVGAARRM